MTTPTTDFGTIMDAQIAVINGLAPSTNASRLFRPHVAEADFDSWVLETVNAALRRYEVSDESEDEEPDIVNQQIVLERSRIGYRFAYPHHFGLYGFKTYQDINKVIQSDRAKITDALRACENYVSGQHSASQSSSIEKEDQVTFLVVISDITYYRAAN